MWAAQNSLKARIDSSRRYLAVIEASAVGKKRSPFIRNATQVRASGGGGRSPLWRQIQADIFDKELCTVAADEGAAFGAALVAAVGAGGFGSVEEACAQSIRLTNQTHPIIENVKRHADYYDVYRSLYGALKPSFDTVTRLAVAG